MFGFGVGIFFFGYVIFEVPSNLILERVGARQLIARIMISWGVISASFVVPSIFAILQSFDLPSRPGKLPGVDETCRVDEGVAPLAPHRSGRADFPHPVPHARDSSSWCSGG
jgi:hypothetical protein